MSTLFSKQWEWSLRACVWYHAVHKYIHSFLHVSDNFTDAAVTGRINGEHKEKDLEPWDGGETHNSDSLESLDTDVVRKVSDTRNRLVLNLLYIQPKQRVCFMWSRAFEFVHMLIVKFCLCYCFHISLMGGIPMTCSSTMRRNMESCPHMTAACPHIRKLLHVLHVFVCILVILDMFNFESLTVNKRSLFNLVLL